MSKSIMNTKADKKEFVKSKFIDAAKSIIFKEGVGAVTVRGVAEMTGYSYATIYHYFSDLIV